ncbi:hypothetical protein, partial [Bacillus cereus]|uniref:hypothetical protein n=1 Tax=Bacillus cereus TaxID=1396 RepID=UPI001C3ED9B8
TNKEQLIKVNCSSCIMSSIVRISNFIRLIKKQLAKANCLVYGIWFEKWVVYSIEGILSFIKVITLYV